MANAAGSSDDLERTSYATDRWQFSIKDGLLSTAVVAVTLGGVRLQQQGLSAALFGAGVLFIAVGLLQQSLLILRAVRQESSLPPASRSAWRFAAAWRAAVAFQLMGGMAISWLGWENLVDRDSFYGDSIYVSGARAEAGWLYLLLIVGMSTTPHCVPRQLRLGRRWLNYGAWGLALVLAFLLLHQSALIPALVHIGINGIELSQPYRVNAGVVFTPGLADRRTAFLHLSWLALGGLSVALAGAVCLRVSALRKLTGRQRLYLLGATLLCLVAAGSATAWIRAVDLRAFSTHLGATLPAPSLEFWVTGGGLSVLFGCCASYRLIGYSSGTLGSLPWRTRRCLHESRAVFGLLVCGFVLEFDAFRDPDWWTPNWSATLAQLALFTELLDESALYVQVAAMLVAVLGLFGYRRRLGERLLVETKLLPLTSFVVYAVLSSALLIVIADLTRWSSFVYWMVPFG